VNTELRLKSNAGEEIPVQLSSTPTTSSSKDGALLYQTAIVDLRDRRRVEKMLLEGRTLLEKRIAERTAELLIANRELKKEIKRGRGLEGKILEISDREQQHLGDELHDGICQHLTAVSLMARATALRLRNHRVLQVEDIEKIAELVSTAAADVRNLARGLHRSDVGSAGLVEALQGLADREIWRTPCRLEVKRPFFIENDTAAAHLYRIAREAVINANKHAQAREIVVGLKQSRKGIVLSITDNGVGLPSEPNKAEGLGFHIMKYRAQSAGGRLEIESGKKGGTRVVCYMPEPK
jgi:signal transduction histidine kinase